ncbi:hypothetical protein GN244_ATG16961 [Phytophthora infestans]|uniref:Uncharacterized protein n=1 Tax=Phytophthora infestans TaxID=4787 RepID=A0A833S2F4_PHYIN|nr:hypothetical protein GN244_ATG16961 [Phytophthora infestans]
MGVQQDFLPRIQRSQPQPAKSPRGLSRRSSFRRHSHPAAIELPEDLTRFSLSHMRHMAIPPVLIPDTLNDRRAIRTVVSGKRSAHHAHVGELQKEKTKHLDMIDEYVTYR